MYFRYLASALMLLALTSCVQAAPPIEGRKEKIKAMESKATGAALERKARSIARLKSEGVPVIEHLPAIEDVQEARHRTKEEIAWRAMALLVVAVKGEGLEQPVVEKIVNEYGLREHFTPDEAAFIQQQFPADHDRVQFAWRYEAAWTLLWALSYVEALGKPTGICDVRVHPRYHGHLREGRSRP